MFRITPVGFLLTLLTSNAFATDYYVDVTNGNDGAVGTSPTSAWRTLTHASTAAAAGSGHTIHVAPGTYSPASGEVFPLEFRLQSLVSSGDSTNTIVDANGAIAVMNMINVPATPVPGGLTELRGVTLRNASVGIYAYYSWNALTCRLEDVVLESCSQQGLYASCGAFIGSGSSVHFQFDRVIAAFCGAGARIDATAGTSSIDAVDSTFSSDTYGVQLSGGSSLNASFSRCRFTSNASYGLWATPTQNGTLDLEVSDSLFAQNGIGYATTTGIGSLATAGVRLRRCTFTQNGTIGIQSKGGPTPAFVSTTLDGVLAWGNGVDLDATNVVRNAFSQIGGADPLFRDAPNGDYRVLFGSPVVDVGDPAVLPGTLDLDSVPRSIDGDLDTIERADVGAFEFRTLEVESTGSLTSPLRIDAWGSAGSTATVYFSRIAPVGPTSTPFGEIDMPQGQYALLLSMPVGPNPPGSFTRNIPPNPLLIGRTFSFQARTTSPVAPSGAAWTNVQAVTFVP